MILPLNTKNVSDVEICVYSAFLTLDSLLRNNTESKLIGFDEFLLAKPLTQIITQYEDDDARAIIQLIKSLIVYNAELESIKIVIKKKKKEDKKQIKKNRSSLYKINFSELLMNENVSRFLDVNKFDSITYINKEKFENLVDWLYQIVAVQSFSSYKKALSSLKDKNTKKATSKKKLTKQNLERELINVIKGSYLSAKNLKWLASESGYDLTRFSSSLINI